MRSCSHFSKVRGDTCNSWAKTARDRFNRFRDWRAARLPWAALAGNRERQRGRRVTPERLCGNQKVKRPTDGLNLINNELWIYLSSLIKIKVRHTEARCDFEDIPPGTYALAIIHDENMNGKLDTNWLGIPTEGYGFSNDVKALLGVPSLSAASFQYDGGPLDLTISLHY